MEQIHTNIIYITENCNLRCKYCFQGLNKQENKMSIEDIKRIIDNVRLKENNKCRFMFFGGEIMMNYDVLIYGLEYIKTLNNNGCKITACLTTNATLLTPQKISKLFTFKSFLNVEVSIDGTKENHDRNRQFIDGKGTHDIVLKKSKMLLQYFPFCVVRVGIEFPNTIFENVKYLHNQGFKIFCIQAINGSKYKYNDNDLIIFKEQIEKAKKYFQYDPFFKIQTVNYPIINGNKIINNDKHTYRYFSTNGIDIIQKAGSYNSFTHFNKKIKGDENDKI